MKLKRLQSIQKDLSVIKFFGNQKGFSLLEVILAGAIFVLIISALAGVLIYGQESTILAGKRTRAVFLAEEGLEAIRNIRDNNFSSLVNGNYGIAISGGQWSFSGTQDTTDVFTRIETISTIDADRKLITSNITWQQNLQRTGNVILETYLTNWQKVVSMIGNWATTTLAASINFSGNNDGHKIQVVGNYAYVIRDDGTPDFIVIDVSVPASPVIIGSLSLPGAPQNIFVLGNYAYVASNSDSQELQIINISVPSSPSVVGVYNAPGNADALGIYVVGTTAYLTRANSADNELVIINVETPATPTLIGSLNLSAAAYEIVVSGNYAYIASGNNSQELQVVDISTPIAPFLSGPGFDLSGTTDAITIALAGVTVFIGQGSTLYTVNVTNPILPVQLGSVGVIGTVNDIALNLGNTNTYLFIATSDTAGEFKVINVATFVTPVILGQFNVSGNNPLFGAAYNTTLDRAFMVGSSDNQEFVVIAPQ